MTIYKLKDRVSTRTMRSLRELWGHHDNHEVIMRTMRSSWEPWGHHKNHEVIMRTMRSLWELWCHNENYEVITRTMRWSWEPRGHPHLNTGTVSHIWACTISWSSLRFEGIIWLSHFIYFYIIFVDFILVHMCHSISIERIVSDHLSLIYLRGLNMSSLFIITHSP